MVRGIRIFRDTEPAFEVCAFSYYVCHLVAGETCPVKKNNKYIEDISRYKKETAKALSCKYLGVKLSIKQYENRRLGVVV